MHVCAHERQKVSNDSPKSFDVRSWLQLSTQIFCGSFWSCKEDFLFLKLYRKITLVRGVRLTPTVCLTEFQCFK